MKLRLIAFGLLLLLVMGCDSDVFSPARLLVKEIEDPTCYKDYFCYEGGKLSTFKRFFGEREETTITFYYTDNKLKRVEKIRDQGFESYFDLTYNEKGLRHQEKLTTIYNGEVSYTRIGTFNYINNELKSIKYTFDQPDYSTQEREFHWSKGNLIRTDFFHYVNNNKFPSVSRSYNYDDKLNYSNQEIAFVYIVGDGDETMVSRNNLLSIQEISDTHVYEGGQYSFTYNHNGYPVESIYKSGGQEFTPIQIRYY